MTINNLNKRPIVSVLIPVYNADKYLDRCLNSILTQTYPHLNIVLVNDGSNDKSLEICHEFSLKYPNIEVHDQQNSGVATSRNKLIDHIKGQFFLFVDSDDWIEKDMIESMLDMIIKHNLDIAVCSSISEKDNDNITEIYRDTEPPKIWNQNESIREFLYHTNLNGSLWNKLIKTDIISGIKFDSSISYGEDALFLWQCLQRVNRLGVTRSQFYHYRMNDSSISHQAFGQKKMTGHKVWKRFAEDSITLWPQYSHIARANFAVSDFWLLVFAAKDKYPEDENIRCYRNNLNNNLGLIRKLNLLSPAKFALATSFSISYRLAGYLMRGIKKNWNF